VIITWLAISFQRALLRCSACLSHAFCGAPSSVRPGSSVVAGGQGWLSAPSDGLHGWSPRNWRQSSRNSSPVLRLAAREPVGVVVLDLVVVPDRHQREAAADLEQVRIRVVEPVRAPVVAERLRLAVLGRLVLADRLLGVGLLVDVVAEAHHQVDVAARQVAVRGVEPGAPLLAGEERDRDRLAAARWPGGPEAPRRRAAVLRDEAVVVLLAGLQRAAGEPGAHGPVVPGLGEQALAMDHPAEAGVPRDLDAHERRLVQPLEAGPQRDRARPGLAGRDALAEGRVPGQSELASVRGRGPDQDDGATPQRGAADEGPAVVAASHGAA
jgi:hypothetical protein